MSRTSKLFHKLIQRYQRSSHREFVRALAHLEETQTAKLFDTLKLLEGHLKETRPSLKPIQNYQDFSRTFPITGYGDYAALIDDEKSARRKTLPKVVRFQPTSGSTDKIKWIPYTEQLLKDFDAALGPWLYDFYTQAPQTLRGPHYWSLSWLPEDLRNEGLCLDDTELFPFWKRLLLKQTMAVTAPVDRTPTSESSMYATVAYLIATPDLSFVSVWSPTFWFTLMKTLEDHRESLALSLANGAWSEFAAELRHLDCPRAPERARLLRSRVDVADLWPKLCTLSAWNTSTSAATARRIEQTWPRLRVVGKGLWSTEACVTIPFRGRYVLATRSHFFEFEDHATGEVRPAWLLRLGQIVSPIVTTSGGLLRYKMQDVLRVSGFEGQTPCLDFLGRADGVDLVGEKTSHLRAIEVLDSIATENRQAFLFAVRAEKSYYCAVLHSACGRSHEDLSARLEASLAESFHYRLARELGQLGAAKVHLVPEPLKPYTQIHLNRGMVLGNIKLEPLRLVTEHEFIEGLACL
jgi:hypothetical protein